MKIAYINESGTPELSGSTSHFVLLAVALDAQTWKSRDQAIAAIKGRYGVGEAGRHYRGRNRQCDCRMCADH